MRRVAVVGAGVIGLSAAWELARSGCEVDIFDQAPGSGATFAAAGMLAPVSETAYGEARVLEFGLLSRALWPQFAARLEAATGRSAALRGTGTLVTALDSDDARQLRRFAALLSNQGIRADVLGSREVRRLEPALSPRVSAGLMVEGDHSVDNRALVGALVSAVTRAGARLHRARAGVLSAGGRVVGVQSLSDGSRHDADAVVLAAGASAGAVPGVPRHALPPLRAVKGQILRLRGQPGVLHRTIRAHVGGQPVYLVPRADGGLVVGATTEDVGHDTRVTAGAVHDLLRRAVAVLPETAEHELVEATARLRPATPDNTPVVGWTPVEGLLLAGGHYRGGVLMAPATAAAVTDLVLCRPIAPVVAALTPLRFLSPTQGEAP